MLNDFITKNRKIILLIAMAVLQAALLVAVHFLVGKKVLPAGGNMMAILDLKNVQFNTPGYFTGRMIAAIILAMFIGGGIVAIVTKLVQMLAAEWKLTDNAVASALVPLTFLTIGIVLFIIALIAKWNLAFWGFPVLAYFTGIILWGFTVKWKEEIKKGFKI